jgi:hypothetical protein
MFSNPFGSSGGYGGGGGYGVANSGAMAPVSSSGYDFTGGGMYGANNMLAVPNGTYY